jgi:hypothetical protein
MNNTLAISLGVCIFVFLAVDYTFFDWAMTIVLCQKFWELTDYIAFWR